MRTWLDKLAWLVDPIAASLTIYRPGHAPEAVERPEIVEGKLRSMGSSYGARGSGLRLEAHDSGPV